jgi:hypothetical protein
MPHRRSHAAKLDGEAIVIPATEELARGSQVRVVADSQPKRRVGDAHAET